MGRPVRRVLSGWPVDMLGATVDGHLSRRHVAAPLQRPTRGLGEPRQHPLSGLAPDEVYLAGRVTTTPVVSYTTLSPLPAPTTSAVRAVCSLWHCLADCSGWALPTVLPCGARTFLGTGEPVTRPSSRPIRVVESTGAGRVDRPVTPSRRSRRFGDRGGSRGGTIRTGGSPRPPPSPAPLPRRLRRARTACAR